MNDTALAVDPSNPLDYQPWTEDNLLVAFVAGSERRRFISRQDIQRVSEMTGIDFSHYWNEYRVCASHIFNGLGTPSDYGFVARKPQYENSPAGACILQLLSSFEVPHEQKLWTVGYALWAWFTYIPGRKPNNPDDVYAALERAGALTKNRAEMVPQPTTQLDRPLGPRDRKQARRRPRRRKSKGG